MSHTTNAVALPEPDLLAVRSFLLGLQTRITSAISNLDGQAFVADRWQKALGEPLQGDAAPA